MMRDLKSYFQTDAKKLSKAPSMEDFQTESELEFWSLAAEHVSRKELPKFIDIIRWMDLLYKAPIHAVYQNDNYDRLYLYRHQVLPDNIETFVKAEGEKTSEEMREQVKEYEDQLNNLDNAIPWDDKFLEMGTSMHTIGKCEHIPIYQEENLWGIYCVGPYVESPDRIKSKLPIVARMLSNWFDEMDAAESNENYEEQETVSELAIDLGTGTLNIDRIASLMLSYLANMKSATFGGVVELTQEGPEFLATHNIDESLVDWFELTISPEQSLSDIEEKFKSDSPVSPDIRVAQVKFDEFRTGYTRAVIFLGLSGPAGINLEIESRIWEMLKDLLVYRRQNLEISNKLIETYYTMLRAMEKKKEHTYYHTPRLVALADYFGKYFGLDPEEQERLQMTARLHDVGYIVTEQLDDRLTVGAGLEHPFIGRMIVEALPLHKDVKEGVKTHHEWINGSGTPYGIKGENIPWTGKIIGLLEFVNEFIEAHKDDDSKSGKQWIEILKNKIIDRAESQFDMVLAPTATELISSLGWDTCCVLGSDEDR